MVDDGGAPAGTEVIGELQVRGATLFDGYLGRGPAPLTADGWFDTGDAAVRMPTASYRILGRSRDDLIKTGGYRVGAGEIEAVLLDASRGGGGGGDRRAGRGSRPAHRGLRRRGGRRAGATRST